MRIKPLIDLLSAFLTPVIGFTVAYIAYQQYRTNKLKFKLSKYEKSLSMYQEVKKLNQLDKVDSDNE